MLNLLTKAQKTLFCKNSYRSFYNPENLLNMPTLSLSAAVLYPPQRPLILNGTTLKMGNAKRFL